jgi:hypothetical protein
MSNLERQLARKLYRVDCPDSQELGDYYLELTPGDRRQQIRQHLEVCPHCQEELASLIQYLKTLEPELQPGFLERARVWIAERLPDFSSSGLAPAFGMRGDNGPERLFAYQAGEAQVSLEIQEGTEARWTLLGLVLGVDAEGFAARLWQNGEPVGETDVDELGNFVLGIPGPGVYELILAGPDGEIHIQNLEV